MSEAAQQQWTITRLLDWTTEYFSQSSIGNARLEAETLLAEALGCQRIELYTRFDEIPDAQPMAEFRKWVKRRGAGEPVAYLVGYREFYSLRFAVNSDVLIPRPETEHVVVAALEAAQAVTAETIRIADIGTGSGCIAITLASQIANSKIAAIDISSAALDVARANAATHNVDQQVKFFEGDLLEALPTGSQPLHLIVSNPPYIGSDEIETVDEQVRNHEPAIALFSGDHGTEIIERLIEQAANFLLPNGFLIFETSPIIIETCVKRINDHPAFVSASTEKDFSGLQRIVIAQVGDQDHLAN